ncbi:MAG: methionyl-tRNA formyltransferase [Tepidisphaeraceae bacterium]|jgi:methionyl-tRNA formyltransferase
MRVIFAGSGAFGLPTLEALKPHVVQVVSQPDHPAGRGRKLTPTPISKFALENNLPLLRTPDINAETLAEADVMVVIAFGQKISPAKVSHPRLGSINLHASLLPRFRGAAPIVWTMLSGANVAGNSVIRLAERMDAGAILAQSQLDILPLETAGELHDRLASDGAPLIQRVLDDLISGRAVETAQDESLACPAPKIHRRDAKLDFTRGSQEIARRIRALWPWPGCHVRLLDAAGDEIQRLSLARAKKSESEGDRWRPGEIETTGAVRCGDGAIEILELQPEGRRPMALADFRRGHGWMPGMRVQSITE